MGWFDLYSDLDRMGEEGWIGGLGWFDLGGMDLQEKIDTKEHPLSHWEKEVCFINSIYFETRNFSLK